MQPVADLHFLQIAEIGVELLQRHIFVVMVVNACVMVETDIANQIENLPFKAQQPARIDA